MNAGDYPTRAVTKPDVVDGQMLWKLKRLPKVSALSLLLVSSLSTVDFECV